MGLFDSSKLRVKKEMDGGSVHMFVNYYKLRNEKGLKFNLIRDLIGGNRCLVVIDTNFIIRNNKTDKAKGIQNLTEFLDKQSIRYDKIITTSDANFNIMGFMVKLNDSKKEKNYIVGFAVSADEFPRLESIIDKFNAFYYVDLSHSSPEELMDKFNVTHGHMDELSNLFEYSIFNVNFTYQIRINMKEDKVGSVEDVIQRYR